MAILHTGGIGFNGGRIHGNHSIKRSMKGRQALKISWIIVAGTPLSARLRLRLLSVARFGFGEGEVFDEAPPVGGRMIGSGHFYFPKSLLMAMASFCDLVPWTVGSLCFSRRYAFNSFILIWS